MDGGACSPWGGEKSDTTEQLHFHFSLSCIGEGKGNPLQCSCLENLRDRGVCWAAVYGVARVGHVQFNSVTQSCPTLCDPMNCSMPGLPVHHQLPEFTQMSIQSVIPSNHLILCHSLLLPSIFPTIRVFSNESGLRGQSIGVSASTSVLAMNTQD